jgi:hypothetical protein
VLNESSCIHIYCQKSTVLIGLREIFNSKYNRSLQQARCRGAYLPSQEVSYSSVKNLKLCLVMIARELIVYCLIRFEVSTKRIYMLRREIINQLHQSLMYIVACTHHEKLQRIKFHCIELSFFVHAKLHLFQDIYLYS